MGCNAIRTSHNAPTPEFLNACDQLGMLVLDENRRLGTNAEPMGELQRQVLRDRNHPSVFMWSLCNEEWDMQTDSAGRGIVQAMQNLVHSLDSTRLCTAGINGSLSGVTFGSVLDVKGLNYNIPYNLDSYYPRYPYSPIIGTEVGSTVTTRGIYTNDTVNGYVASYDIITMSGLPNPMTWGETAEDWWQIYAARPWASGGFNWTGFDYRGEPTPYNWPCINSHFGQMDTCGFPKDLFYYYQANWTLKPVLHLFPHWNWTTGRKINVWVYGNCQTVTLYTNGVSLGQQTLNVQGHIEWDNVTYASGTLQAIGYNNNVAVITNTVVTTGTPAAIALVPDRSTILDDGLDVSVVTVEVLDAQGRVVPTATNNINFSITGGTIIGVGNGNPSSHEPDQMTNQWQRQVFNGLAEVIVQSTNQPGSIVLTATSSGLTSTNVTITEAATLPPPAAPTGVAAVVGNMQVTVTWDIVPGAATYNLWRATTSGGPYTLIAGNIGGVNCGYTDNITSLANFYYVVTANGANGNGNSTNSAEVSASFLTAPTLAPISNQTVNVGQTVAFTASATDTNSPQPSLNFSLLNGPASATLAQINNTKANFNWRPAVTNANSTNVVALMVAVSNSPGLSATQNFTITVNPLPLPTVSSVVWNNGRLTLDVTNSILGPDYSVQASSNLFNWSTLFITNSPPMPFSWTDTNAATLPAQFFRIKVGPPLP
jgi:hypothetical protein